MTDLSIKPLYFFYVKVMLMSALREKILTVASDLFQTRGINSTGVDTIVAVAGTTKMTLYKYFKSKEILILEVLQQGHDEFQAWLNTKLNQSSKKPAEKLQKLFDFIEEWITAPEFRGMAFIKASAEFPNEENVIHKLSAEHAREFRSYIAALASEAGVIEPEALALQLSMLIEGAIQSEQMKRGSGAIKYAKKAAKVLIDMAQKNLN
jgi:AcrR family transcriptional regulator